MDNTFSPAHITDANRVFYRRRKRDNVVGLASLAGLGGIAKEVGKQISTDAVLIRTRDKLYSMFKAKGFGPGTPVLDSAATQNRLGHKDIPNRKIAGDYSEEWQRLYQFVIDMFNGMGRPDYAMSFQSIVPVFTPTSHPITYVQDLLNGKVKQVAKPAPLVQKTDTQIRDTAKAIAAATEYLPESVKKNITESGAAKVLQDMTRNPISRETLPKNRSMKRMEEITQPATAQPGLRIAGFDLSDPVVLIVVIVVVLVILGSVFKR